MAVGSGFAARGEKRNRGYKYFCGVPTDKCIGSLSQLSNGIRRNPKTHSSPEQAFKCYAKYLLTQGYIQVGPREFASPNDGPILVLTKKSRFGARLRGGKGARYMPEKMLGGTIY